MITKIYIYQAEGDETHALNVYGAFAQALGDNNLGWSGTVYYGTTTIAAAAALGCELYIKSYTGMSSLIATALLSYPGIQTIMPSGSNTYEQIYNSDGSLPNIIVTGAGDVANETGYDIEFFAPDTVTIEPDLSSFSNGYIAGQTACVVNSLNCSIWEARFRMQQTASRGGVWVNTNGFGLIDIEAAILFSGTIISDPYIETPNVYVPEVDHVGTVGTLTAIKNTDAILSWTTVTNADTYKVYKSVDNGVTWTLIYEGALLTYSDAITFGKFQYKYKAEFTNVYEVLETTAFSAVAEIKRAYSNTIRLMT